MLTAKLKDDKVRHVATVDKKTGKVSWRKVITPAGTVVHVNVPPENWPLPDVSHLIDAERINKFSNTAVDRVFFAINGYLPPKRRKNGKLNKRPVETRKAKSKKTQKIRSKQSKAKFSDESAVKAQDAIIANRELNPWD